jgi:MFS transporter, DHA1 family, tetracycline resistance protein
MQDPHGSEFNFLNNAELVANQAFADPSRRKALFIVVLVMFIDLLGFGIVLPLLPRYGREFVDPLFPGSSASIRFLRGATLGMLMASFSLMQFIFAPIWGRISDWKGRRPFLLLGLVGSVIFYALFGLASELGYSGKTELDTGRVALGLVLLFVARVGAGIAGATVSTAQAVIADTTTPEHRSRGMALIGAAFGVGFTFGPAVGAGALAVFHDAPSAPGYVASAICFLALVLSITLMPETVRPGVPAGRRTWFNASGFRNAFHTPTVGLLIGMFFLSTLAFGNFEATLALLTRDILHFEDRDNLYVFTYVGFVLLFAQGGLYQVLARRGTSELTFILIGASLMIVGLGGLGEVTWISWQPGGPEDAAGQHLAGFLLTATAAVSGFAFVTPSVQSLISRRSDPAKQGEVLGVNQSVNAFSRILGPIIAVSLYGLQPMYPYVAGVTLLAFVLLAVPRVRRQ